MTSDLDEVMYVNNPIEAGLPGHWVPLSVIKRVLEMRASAVNYWTTPRKVKLKHLTIPLSHFKTSKHKAKSKHNLITTLQDTTSPDGNELSGKSIKIEPETLNNVKTTTKGLEDTTITETAISTNENIDLNAFPSTFSAGTNEFNNRDTGSTTFRATTVLTTNPITKGTSEIIVVTNQLGNITTTPKTTSCTSKVLSTSTPIPVNESPTNEVSSTLDTSSTASTTTSEQITTTIATIPDTTKLTTNTTATIPDTTKPTKSSTAITPDTTKPTTSSTAISPDTTKPTTSSTAITPDTTKPTTSSTAITPDTTKPTKSSTTITPDTTKPTTSSTAITPDTSEPITSSTAITADTSEPITSTTTIITNSEPSTTSTPMMTSMQSTVITTEDSSERSDTGNPFY